jgi:hypothetical protein
VSVDSSPPVQPPQLSPDGQWVWDGTQWRPVVTAEPVHAGVFPAFGGIQVDTPDPATQFVDPPVAAPAVQYHPPGADYSYQQADEPAVPLWRQTRSTGINMFLYPIAGIAVLGMAMIVLNSIGFIQLPFVSTSSNTNTPAPTANASPTPDFSGPDSARASRFLNKYLAPTLTALDKANTTQNLRCQGHRTSQCFDALTATDVAVKSVLAVINTQDIPKCIGPQVSAVLTYVQGMDKELQLALAAFNDNSDDELITGVYRFRTYYKLMTSALAATNDAAKSCHTMVLPSWVP